MKFFPARYYFVQDFDKKGRNETRIMKEWTIVNAHNLFSNHVWRLKESSFSSEYEILSIFSPYFPIHSSTFEKGELQI